MLGAKLVPLTSVSSLESRSATEAITNAIL